MISGTPIATTTIGIEGLSDELTWAGIANDDIEDYIKRATELYTDRKLWEEKQCNGLKIVKHNFSKVIFENDFKELIKHRVQNLASYRSKNVTGELLKYHMHKSTKYMSLWIQEKNA